MGSVRIVLAGLIVVVALALLVPSVQRFLDGYFSDARARFGFAEGLPMQRAVIAVFSGMLIFFALTVVI